MNRLLALTLFLVCAGCPDPEPEQALPALPPVPPAATPAVAPPSAAEPTPGKPEPVQPLPPGFSLQAGAKDVVCGRMVSLAGEPATVKWGETTYLFCGDGCARAFQEEPKTFLRKTKSNGK